MKKCTTCQEEFADKFSFCPVDGTPLKIGEPPAALPLIPLIEPRATVSARLSDTFQGSVKEIAATTPPAFFQANEPVAAPPGNNGNGVESVAIRPPKSVAAPVFAASAAGFAKYDGDLHLTILEEKSLFSRLGGEVAQIGRASQLTWPEFKRDPFGFVRRTITGYGAAIWAVLSRPAVATALLTAVAAVGFVVAVIFLLDRRQTSGPGLSKTSITVIAVSALMLLGGLLTAWLKRERPMPMEGVAGAGGARFTESGSSNNDLAAVIVALVCVLAVGLTVLFWSRIMPKRLAATPEEQLELTEMIPEDIPKKEEPPKKEGAAGTNKGSGGGSKPKPEVAHGGGGGGDVKENRPVSKGEPPIMAPEPQIVVPKPAPPPERPPLLPVLATIKGDAALSRIPRSTTFGDPDSTATDPSRGKGEGDGFGGGKGTGAGKGDGAGLGPGRGENTGGGDPNYGGGGKGGGGDNKPPPKPEIDYDRPFSAKEVTRKAVITSKPEPPYTEEARKNNTVGTVTLRVLLASNGSVSQVSPINRLPFGLTESALAAARKIRFTPAQKDGHNVSQWIQIQYDFNLY